MSHIPGHIGTADTADIDTLKDLDGFLGLTLISTPDTRGAQPFEGVLKKALLPPPPPPSPPLRLPRHRPRRLRGNRIGFSVSFRLIKTGSLLRRGPSRTA